MLVKKDSLWIVKARRLGLTWLLAAYAIWLVTFHANRTVLVLNQSAEYSQDFLDRCRFIYESMPVEFKQHIGKDNTTRIHFLNTGGSIRSVAATKRSIRSVSGDLIIFDEAAYFAPGMLKKAKGASQPAVEIGKGQVVAISTAAQPGDEFHKFWEEANRPGSKYRPVFLHWKEHPDRTDEWYAKEKADNESDPLYMKREYPASPEEAFEYAEGRIYPLFVRSGNFVRSVNLEPSWIRYRGIDWGGVDAFVCLWGCVIPGDGAALTIDPSCSNLINEMLAYGYDEHGKPKDENNHAPDALRYLVTTPGSNGITGHLHIYRELYIPNSAAKGYGITDLSAAIKTASGVEPIEMTVCDRSRPDSLQQLRNEGFVNVKGQKNLRSERIGEIVQGIVHVNSLVVGTSKGGDGLYQGLKPMLRPPVNKPGGFFG